MPSLLIPAALPYAAVAARMSRLGKSEIANGEILTVDEILRRVQGVTLEDARRIAHRVLSQPMTLTVLGPVTSSSFAGALV